MSRVADRRDGGTRGSRAGTRCRARRQRCKIPIRASLLHPWSVRHISRPEPGAKPFVEEGSEVTQEQTILIVEAMKTMNAIPAPRRQGHRILVEDGQPVEFGEPLMILEWGLRSHVDKILIANRGEIALRKLRACKGSASRRSRCIRPPMRRRCTSSCG